MSTNGFSEGAITCFDGEYKEVESLPTERGSTVTLELSTRAKIFDDPFNYINSKTIMLGASKSWDKTRLITGKLSKLLAIDDLPVELKTTAGTSLSASHIYCDAFKAKIEENRGIEAKVKISLNHPLLSRAKPVTILDSESLEEIQGAKIDYSLFLEEEFKDPTALQDFLSLNRLIALDQSTLEPVSKIKDGIFFSSSSNRSNLLIVPISEWKRKKFSERGLIFKDLEQFSSPLEIFAMNDKEEDVIFFESENPFTEVLEELKINKTPWELLKTTKGVFIVRNTSLLSNIVCKEPVLSHPFLNLEINKKPEEPPQKTFGRGVVILSMNQTNSYTQYTHEILTFLLSGIDVFTYDHPGKGCSVGSNSENGLMEAIFLSGLYLREMGYADSRMLFKGQCAGGVPTSIAPYFFKEAHVWIDQAPSNFKQVAVEIAQKYIEENKDSSKLCSIANTTMSIIKPLLEIITSLIMPGFDIIESLDHGSGIVLYSIGIPDETGHGGDSLVPKGDIEGIIQKLGRIDKESVFLPIVGGTHVTDWWSDPAIFSKVQKVLEKHRLCIPN